MGVLQGCYGMLHLGTWVCEKCFMDDTGILQGFYRGVTGVLYRCLRYGTEMLQNCYRDGTSMLQGCMRGVTGLLYQSKLRQR